MPTDPPTRPGCDAWLGGRPADRSGGSVIGCAVAVRLGGGAAAEIGREVDGRQRGQGFGTEIARAMAEFC